MSTIAPAQPTVLAPPPLASPAVYRISVDEYERMVGILSDDRVELIDGYLVRRLGKNPCARQVVARAGIIAAMPCQEGSGDQPQVIGDSSFGGGISLGPSGRPRNTSWRRTICWALSKNVCAR